MKLALLEFELLIHGAESLKDKRRIVKGLKDRLHREHMVSVAETGLLDRASAARLGLATVGSDARRLSAVLDRIIDKLRGLGDAELGDLRREVVDLDASGWDDGDDEGRPLWTEAERRQAEPRPGEYR